jgi:anti-sigma regulatory factor (Ser/Thr protein kinase)
MRIPPGPEAPRRARDAVIARVGAQLGRQVAQDVRIVVSELVTTCVRHAPDGAPEVDVGVVRDRVLITVSDPGADTLSRPAADDPANPHALGLLVVDRLARSWGVARDGAGRTRVWCELELAAR